MEIEEATEGLSERDTSEQLRRPRGSKYVNLESESRRGIQLTRRKLMFVVVGIVVVACAIWVGISAYRKRMSSESSAYLGNDMLEHVRFVTLEVKYATLAPDGFYRRVIAVNGTVPGPTIEAFVGDTLVVNVVNSLDVVTTIHWHGIFQRGTPFFDGTEGIAQCGIPAGESMLYKFQVNQTGTFWYHSHAGGQYGNGLYGALIVHSYKETHEYHEERVLTLSDWYHTSVEALMVNFLSMRSHGKEPVPDSGLINGKGKFNCSYVAYQRCEQRHELDLYSTTLIVGNIYRFRLISTAALATFFFSIDEHNLTVIEVDGIDTEKREVSVMELSPGQRASVLVEPNASGNFWIRSRMDTTIFSCENEMLDSEILGILRVRQLENAETGKNEIPQSESSLSGNDMMVGSYFMQEELGFKPVQYQNVPEATVKFTLPIGMSTNAFNVTLPTINGYSTIYPSTPILHSVYVNKTRRFAPQENVFFVDGGEIVEITLVNFDMMDHPFHLHGHAFWVLSRGGMGSYDSEVLMLNTRNPLMRDTIRVPMMGGYVVIRFIADNPGVWAFHCHVEWHMMAGLGVTFVVDAARIQSDIQLTDLHQEFCTASS